MDSQTFCEVAADQCEGDYVVVAINALGGYDILSNEQKKLAEKTRKLVKTTFGACGEFVAARSDPGSLSGEMQQRFRNLAVNYVTAQWVSAADAKPAEDSFFKINQAATPIDATERRILMARKSPNAIASRSITRAGLKTAGEQIWEMLA